MPLTPKQIAFIEAYEGNGTDAARKAGYKGDDKVLATQAIRLLRNVEIKKAVQQRQEKRLNPLIATREQRQRFWTEVMRDDSKSMKDRLKASELLGKSNCDFVERIEHSGIISLEKLVTKSIEES